MTLDGAPFTSLSLTPDQWDVMANSGHELAGHVGITRCASELRGQWSRELQPGVEAQRTVERGARRAAGPLTITVSYDKTTLTLDETVTATVTVTSNTGTIQNMILVTVGLPPGFDVMTEIWRHTSRQACFLTTS